MLRFRAIFAASAFAFGAVTLTAAPANAIPESTIKSECAAAGGVYSSYMQEGILRSTCCYPDITGHVSCDVYKGGTFVFTIDQQAPPDPTKPAGVPTQVTPPALQPTGPTGPVLTAIPQAPTKGLG